VSVIQATGEAGRLTSPFGWEQHCCLPLQAERGITPLRRYLDAGVSYLSVNVGFAPHDIDATMRVLGSWRRRVLLGSELFASGVNRRRHAGRPAARPAGRGPSPWGGSDVSRRRTIGYLGQQRAPGPVTGHAKRRTRRLLRPPPR